MKGNTMLLIGVAAAAAVILAPSIVTDAESALDNALGGAVSGAASDVGGVTTAAGNDLTGAESAAGSFLNNIFSSIKSLAGGAASDAGADWSTFEKDISDLFGSSQTSNSAAVPQTAVSPLTSSQLEAGSNPFNSPAEATAIASLHNDSISTQEQNQVSIFSGLINNGQSPASVVNNATQIGQGEAASIAAGLTHLGTPIGGSPLPSSGATSAFSMNPAATIAGGWVPQEG